MVWEGIYALSSLNSKRFWSHIRPHNENLKEDLTYLSRHAPISVATHDTLGRKSVHLVNGNPERFIEQFIKVLAEKEETIVADTLKRHPYPSDFQMLPGEVKKKWKEWVNQPM